MNEVKLEDLLFFLRRRELYAVQSETGRKKIKIYPFSQFGVEKFLIFEMPYSHEEWNAFLKKHNCNLNGDYNYSEGGYSNNRVFHQEMEDGIPFEIAAGKDFTEDCNCDWIRIL